jgi:hypothetical protein
MENRLLQWFCLHALFLYAVINLPMKPDSFVPCFLRFLDQVREVIRGKHYSARIYEPLIGP